MQRFGRIQRNMRANVYGLRWLDLNFAIFEEWNVLYWMPLVQSVRHTLVRSGPHFASAPPLRPRCQTRRRFGCTLVASLRVPRYETFCRPAVITPSKPWGLYCPIIVPRTEPALLNPLCTVHAWYHQPLCRTTEWRRYLHRHTFSAYSVRNIHFWDKASKFLSSILRNENAYLYETKSVWYGVAWRCLHVEAVASVG